MRWALAGLLAALATVQMLAEQEARAGGFLFPDLAPGWLIAFSIAFFLLIPRSRFPLSPYRFVAVAVALGVLYWPLSTWRKQSTRPSAGLGVTVKRLSQPNAGPERSARLDYLRFESRRYVRRLAGRRHDILLEIKGFIRATQEGTYHFQASCDDRCRLEINGKTAFNEAGRASSAVQLREGVHRFSLSYRQASGPAFLILRWDRPAFFEFLPMEHYVAGGPESLVMERLRKREIGAGLAFLFNICWWMIAANLWLRVAESKRAWQKDLRATIAGAKRWWNLVKRKPFFQALRPKPMPDVGRKELLFTTRILPPALLVTANLFLFSTFTPYFENRSEFQFGYLDLVSEYAIPAVATLALLLALGLVLGGRALDRYVAVLFGLGVLLWVQQSFLSRGYGVFDGAGIDWASFTWRGWVDAALWVVWLGICLRPPAFVVKVAGGVSWVLFLGQLVLLGWQGFSSPQAFWLTEYSRPGQPPDALYKYSSTRNVVHVVMDSFQTDIFLDIVREEGLEDDLEGFVLFWNNASVAQYTTLSLPAIFTGHGYDGSLPAGDYIKQSLTSGLPTRLYESGFRVNLVPLIPMQSALHSAYFRTPSVFGSPVSTLRRWEAAYLFDVALFRQAPHTLRRAIYDDEGWLVTRLVSLSPDQKGFQHKAFFRDYAERIRTTTSTPAYHFIHLLPPHPPYVTNADGSYAGGALPATRENFKNEGRAVMKIFVDLLERLRSLGIYDSSLIVLQGDHGSRMSPVVDAVKISGLPSRAVALLTVKLPGASGPLEIARTKTTVADVPATVMTGLGLEHDFGGDSVFSLDPDEPRTRLFTKWVVSEEGDSLLEVITLGQGSIFDPASWATSRLVPVATGESEPYALGERVKFGIQGNASPYMGRGWSVPKTYKAPFLLRAEVKFRLPSVGRTLVFTAVVKPMLATVDQQRIAVVVLGERVAEWITTEQRRYTFEAEIPAHLVDSPDLVISLELSDASSADAAQAAGGIGVTMFACSLREKKR